MIEFLPLVVLALLFWLLVIRPQRRRASEQSRIVADLAPGQEVVTMSGLYGRIDAIEGDAVRVEIAPGTVVKVDKRAIGRRVDPRRVEEAPS